MPACFDMKPASTRARSTLGSEFAEPLCHEGLLAQAADVLVGEHDREQPGGRTGQPGFRMGAVIGLDGRKGGFATVEMT